MGWISVFVPRRPQHQWLRTAFCLAVIYLCSGSRSSNLTGHTPDHAQNISCCIQQEPTGSEGQDCPCRHREGLLEEQADAATHGLHQRQLQASRQSPLRVSHNRYSHDLVAMSHSSGSPGGSRLKANAHLQRLGGATPNPLERMLVVAQYREDLSWLQQVSYLPSIIYQADNASAHNKVIRNMGETAAYLQYIVDHYEVLPKQMAFVHGHRKAKHMPDVVPVLQNLQWGRFGYANLRYVNVTLEQWGVWTGDWLHPAWPEQAPDRAEIIWDDLRVSMSRNYAQMWGLLFEQELGRLPDYVHSPCCAEFVVSSERVRRHPRQFYASLLDWLRHTSNDRFWAGRIFEYVWHIIFGEDAVYIAPPKCELLHCSG